MLCVVYLIWEMLNNINNSVWFSRKVSNLKRRTSKLKKRLHKTSLKNIEDLESEANRCLSMLQSLHDYAKSTQVGTKRDCYLIQEIHEEINEVYEILETKKPWWKKLINLLVKVLPFIKNLLNMLLRHIMITNPLILKFTVVVALIASGLEVAGFLKPASDIPLFGQHEKESEDIYT